MAITKTETRTDRVGIVPGVAHFAHIDTRLESAPPSGIDDHPHLVVGVELLPRFWQLRRHLPVEGIEGVGAVVRDGSDVTILSDLDELRIFVFLDNRPRIAHDSPSFTLNFDHRPRSLLSFERRLPVFREGNDAFVVVVGLSDDSHE